MTGKEFFESNANNPKCRPYVEFVFYDGQYHHVFGELSENAGWTGDYYRATVLSKEIISWHIEFDGQDRDLIRFWIVVDMNGEEKQECVED